MRVCAGMRRGVECEGWSQSEMIREKRERVTGGWVYRKEWI